MSADSEPPSPPRIAPKLILPRHRILGIILLSLLPIASVVGAFEGRCQVTEQAGPLELAVRYPTRTLSHQEQSIQLQLRASAPCARAVVGGLTQYLDHYRDLRMTPGHTGVDRLFDGPLSPHQSVVVRIDAQPAMWGIARATLRFSCDGASGHLAMRTVIFP